MKKILVISVSLKEQQMIEEQIAISTQGPYSVDTTASFGQSADWWKQNAPDVLVVRLPEDQSLHPFYFTKLRKEVPKDQATIFICDVLSSALIQTTASTPKLRSLKSPISAEDLWRAIQDQLNDRGAGAATRFMTEQEVLVTSPQREGQMFGKIKNLSVSGLYFETTTNNLGLVKEEVVCLHVMIPDLREYLFNCKVVWIKGLDDGGFGFGVTFVDKDELFNKLLKG